MIVDYSPRFTRFNDMFTENRARVLGTEARDVDSGVREARNTSVMTSISGSIGDQTVSLRLGEEMHARATFNLGKQSATLGGPVATVAVAQADEQNLSSLVVTRGCDATTFTPQPNSLVKVRDVQGGVARNYMMNTAHGTICEIDDAGKSLEPPVVAGTLNGQPFLVDPLMLM